MNFCAVRNVVRNINLKQILEKLLKRKLEGKKSVNISVSLKNPWINYKKPKKTPSGTNINLKIIYTAKKGNIKNTIIKSSRLLRKR